MWCCGGGDYYESLSKPAATPELSKAASYRQRNPERFYPNSPKSQGDNSASYNINKAASASGSDSHVAVSKLQRRPSSTKLRGDQNNSTSKKKCQISRTMMLRIILIGSLLTAAGVCAALAYMSLKSAEQETALQTYNSVAASALDNAKSIAIRKFQASEVTAALASWTNPNAEDWPFIYINGYTHITGKIADVAQSTTQAMMVFLEPDQVPEFETHIQNVYQREGRPETTGVSEFGFGIWKPDADMTYEDGRLHDTTGEVRHQEKKRRMKSFACLVRRSKIMSYFFLTLHNSFSHSLLFFLGRILGVVRMKDLLS